MKQDLTDKRKVYSRNKIDFFGVPASPMALFGEWYKQVNESELISEPYAMHLSTLEADGFPRSRVVLMREFGDEGFVFYTNYDSLKGRAIAAHPEVGVSFFWDKLEQQVKIKGIAEKIPAAKSDDYFHKRPKESQLGAVVSKQSQVIALDADLKKVAEDLGGKYEGMEIKRPDHWGGYLIRPVEIEFWQGRPGRLHDRLRYRTENGIWIKERLAP